MDSYAAIAIVVILILGGFVSYKLLSRGGDDDDYEVDEGGNKRKIRHGNL